MKKATVRERKDERDNKKRPIEW